MDQTELMESSIRMNDGGEKLLFDKVYIDAYAWQNGSYPQAVPKYTECVLQLYSKDHTQGAGPNRPQKLLFDKVYIDAYAWQNGSYPQARADFYRLLNSGAMLWTYIGHGDSLAVDRLQNDISGR